MEPHGSTYASLMQAYGTRIIAGVSPGFGGSELQGIPVFDMVEQAIQTVGAIDITLIFVHPYLMLDAALEAIAAGIRQIILISEGMPPLDMVHLLRQAESTETLIVGPSCPGIILPDQLLLGTYPREFYRAGPVGIISRSGTLTYEVALELTQSGLGQSFCVGIGSDTIIGSSFSQWLQILDEDEQTEVIVLVGEIGGDGEEVAARYIAEGIDKPVVAYIAGRTAPRGKHMGHASAILNLQSVSQSSNLKHLPEVGTAESKIAALKRAKVAVAESPAQIPGLVRKALKLNSKASQAAS